MKEYERDRESERERERGDQAVVTETKKKTIRSSGMLAYTYHEILTSQRICRVLLESRGVIHACSDTILGCDRCIFTGFETFCETSKKHR